MLDEMGEGAEDFFRNRELNNHSSATLAVQSLLGILATGQIKNYSALNSFSARPAMLYAAPISESGFEKWKAKNKALLVGLLLNIRHYKSSGDEFVETIFKINNEINVKYAKHAFSIVSKQGVLTAYPSKGSDLMRDIEREHARRFRFMEYALVLQKFTEQYQQIRVHDKVKAEFLLFLCSPFLREDANLPRTVTGSNTWKLLSNEFSLPKSLSSIEEVHIEESKNQEKYYTKLNLEVYGSLNYLSEVFRVTKPHRNWVLRDLGDKKILGLVITVLALLVAIFKLKH